MSELKPCPFCGGEAELEKRGMFEMTVFDVKCMDCRAIGCGGNTAEKAVAAWNKRASDWIPCSERMPDDDERVLGNITITVNANMMKPKQRTIFAKHDRVLGWTTANGYPIVGKSPTGCPCHIRRRRMMPEKTESKPVPFCAECKYFKQSEIGIKRRVSGCDYYKKLVLAGGYPCEHFERRDGQ